MDNKLVKNYLIGFLIILNFILFILGFVFEEKYVISNEQVQNITNYLEKQNIKLNLTIPKNYYPMSEVTMKQSKYNEIELKKIFFDENKNILRTKHFNDTIFKQDDKTLKINNMFVTFQDLEKKENFDFNKQNIKVISKYYKKNFEKLYGKMVIDIFYEDVDYFLVNYTSKVNDYKNFNNILNLKFYKTGEIEVYFSNYQKIENVTEKFNIYSPDEVIYTFSKAIRNLIPEKEIVINKIDIGYYFNSDIENINFKFTPYYRIYIKDVYEPFYINAYTNTFEYDFKGLNLQKKIL